jgi:hypothetical protein
MSPSSKTKRMSKAMIATALFWAVYMTFNPGANADTGADTSAQTGTEVHAGAPQQEKSCLSVEVHGVRTLPYDCLSQQLLPAAQRQRVTPQLPWSARHAMQPSNELGLFNRSATAIRMGANFGQSAQAQRPPQPESYTPLLPAR